MIMIVGISSGADEPGGIMDASPSWTRRSSSGEFQVRMVKGTSVFVFLTEILRVGTVAGCTWEMANCRSERDATSDLDMVALVVTVARTGIGMVIIQKKGSRRSWKHGRIFCIYSDSSDDVVQAKPHWGNAVRFKEASHN